jgi:hypothetical protein
MNCRYCGTRLVPGAMFCGECGRSVSASAAAPAAVPLLPSPVGAPEFSHAVAEEASSAGTMASPRTVSHCPQCGSPMAADDIFCGECGFVARTVLAPVGASSENDTVAITADPEFLFRMSEPEPEPEPERQPEPEPEPQPEPEPEPSLPSQPEPQAEHEAKQQEGDLEPSVLAEPDPLPFLGERFVLQFSTGESVTVRGTGLIGRNPAMEPGEYVDDLIAIVDEGKSVSKTHLEFGQQDGVFWVSDRFSTNGTVVRLPGSAPRRCEPQHRYLVDRGGRVEIGDEFFVVI